MDKKIKLWMRLFLCICIFIIGACFLYKTFNKEENYANYTASELKECIKKNESKIKKQEVLLLQQENIRKDSAKYKKKIKECKKAIEETENDMFDVQDRALYVGKFICKVNTCQGNPKDPNYEQYTYITKRLVEVKENFIRLKKEKANLEDKMDNISSIENKIKEIEEDIKDLKKSNEEIKQMLRSKV